MSLDYSNSAIFVDVNGNSVQATPLDASGHPLATLIVTVTLDSTHHLIIEPGVTARLALDFNLAASNAVNTAVAPPTVTVRPMLVASVVPLDGKQVRVRGPLVAVDTAAGSYTVSVMPFELDADQGRQITVHVTSATNYELGGVGYIGSAGLTALAALPTGTLTVAFGTLSWSDQSFTASVVEAGSSVVGVGVDALSGTVVARMGNTLTVHSSVFHRMDAAGALFETDDVAVTVGDGTTVSAETAPMVPLTIQAISVGQHIDAFGTAAMNAGSPPSFDATAGRVRLDLTPLLGTLAVPPPAVTMPSTPATLTLALQTLDNLDPSDFNFAGTGTSTATNANVKSYAVTVPVALPLAGLAVNAPVRLFGYVTPFGSAPPDFRAQTLVNYSASDAILIVNWGAGTPTPFITLSATEFIINPTTLVLGTVHEIQMAPQPLDLTQLAASPVVVPDANALVAFTIQAQSLMSPMVNATEYQDYAAFEAALASRLNGTTLLLGLAAEGRYDTGSHTFTATRIGVLLSD